MTEHDGDEDDAAFQTEAGDAGAPPAAQERTDGELPSADMKPTLLRGAAADSRLSPDRLTAAERVPLADRLSGAEGGAG